MDCSSISIYVSVDNDIRFKYALSISELNDCLLFPDEEDLKILQSHSNTNGKILETSNKSLPGGLFCMETNALLIKPFIEEMKSSSCYRKGVYNNLSNKLKEHFEQNGQNLNRQIVLNVSLAESYVIDYAWGWRLWRQCHMGLERDCASAWLSTLGGAFSALGDYFDRCAKMALRISMQQIRLSVMGGDPDGVARGWLFLALALSQLGHGNAAFHLLRMAYDTPTLDDRHHRMCLGVQAKLKYDRKVRRQKRSEGTLSSGDSLLQVLRSITL